MAEDVVQAARRAQPKAVQRGCEEEGNKESCVDVLRRRDVFSNKRRCAPRTDRHGGNAREDRARGGGRERARVGNRGRSRWQAGERVLSIRECCSEGRRAAQSYGGQERVEYAVVEEQEVDEEKEEEMVGGWLVVGCEGEGGRSRKVSGRSVECGVWNVECERRVLGCWVLDALVLGASVQALEALGALGGPWWVWC
jgi:hypothetical protein